MYVLLLPPSLLPPSLSPSSSLLPSFTFWTFLPPSLPLSLPPFLPPSLPPPSLPSSTFSLPSLFTVLLILWPLSHHSMTHGVSTQQYCPNTQSATCNKPLWDIRYDAASKCANDLQPLSSLLNHFFYCTYLHVQLTLKINSSTSEWAVISPWLFRSKKNRKGVSCRCAVGFLPPSSFPCAGTAYGPNISPLTVDVSSETNERLHIKIYDPNNKRWEVPTRYVYAIDIDIWYWSDWYLILMWCWSDDLILILDDTEFDIDLIEMMLLRLLFDRLFFVQRVSGPHPTLHPSHLHLLHLPPPKSWRRFLLCCNKVWLTWPSTNHTPQNTQVMWLLWYHMVLCRLLFWGLLAYKWRTPRRPGTDAMYNLSLNWKRNSLLAINLRFAYVFVKCFSR